MHTHISNQDSDFVIVELDLYNLLTWFLSDPVILLIRALHVKWFHQDLRNLHYCYAVVQSL